MFRANKKFCNLNNYKKDFKHTYILTADSSREIICTTSIIIVKYSIKKRHIYMTCIYTIKKKIMTIILHSYFSAHVSFAVYAA